MSESVSTSTAASAAQANPTVEPVVRAASGPPAPTGWTGWIIFASVILIIAGIFSLIEGLVALFNDGYYLVNSSGLVVHLSYTGWGWAHLILGVLAILVGLGLYTGNMVARVCAVIIAGLSAIANLMFVAAYPVWSILVIALDVIVIYAVTVHGRELKSPATAY